jgi:signal transduction histidine kinase/CheY-like chemotaxis protein
LQGWFHLPPLVVAAAGLLATFGMWWQLRDMEERVVSSRFQLDAEERQIAIEEAVHDAFTVLEALASLRAVHPDMTRGDFGVFTEPMLERAPAIQALGWNPRVLAADRDRHEAAGREAGFRNYEITHRDSQDAMVRAEEREDYVVVSFLEPYEGNESALGFDVSSEERRNEALTRARDTGELTVTQGITLVQERATQLGVLAFLPVYRGRVAGDSVEQRREQIEGYMVGVFRVGDIVENALAGFDPVAIELQLTDEAAGPEERVLYASSPDADPSMHDSGLAIAMDFRSGGRPWRLGFTPTETYLATLQTKAPLGTLVVGLVITALITSYLTAFRRRDVRIASLIAERGRAEEQQRSLERKMLHAQKLESLGVLAGGIAHDFNNLLTGILGNAELALSRIGADEPAASELAWIQRSGNQAAELVHQLLAYSGQGRLVSKPVDLCRLFGDMADLLRASISKKAELRRVFAADVAAVEGDPSQLRQVFMNLLINASDALEDEAGAIELRIRQVDIDRGTAEMMSSAELEPGPYVSVEVSDTGCGMDPATLERLFEPFFTTKFQGRGLGLAAVQGIVRSHGGTIHIRSKPGVGTKVQVLLPASGLAAEPLRGPPALSTWSRSEGGTVLVADDEEIVRDVTQRLLERAGFQIVTAVDGEQALEVFRQHADVLDAVVLDLTMPRLGGRDAFREMHRLHPDVPVILTSGYNEEASLKDLMGVAGFVQKPFQEAELIETVLATIRSRGRRAAQP